MSPAPTLASSWAMAPRGAMSLRTTDAGTARAAISRRQTPVVRRERERDRGPTRLALGQKRRRPVLLLATGGGRDERVGVYRVVLGRCRDRGCWPPVVVSA